MFPARLEAASKRARRGGFGVAFVVDETDEDKWLGWSASSIEQIKDVSKLDGFRRRCEKGRFQPSAAAAAWVDRALAPKSSPRRSGRSPVSQSCMSWTSTDPAQIKAFENKVDLKKTLFLVSSDSGTHWNPTSSNNISRAC